MNTADILREFHAVVVSAVTMARLSSAGPVPREDVQVGPSGLMFWTPLLVSRSVALAMTSSGPM